MYYLFATIALVRGHTHAGAVTLVNLTTCWTGLRWIIAPVWSVGRGRRRDHEIRFSMSGGGDRLENKIYQWHARFNSFT
ncbi:superinfection immunity protein [Microvirga sp. 2TAF3]|uniref:superinfection immunity protein n=1 Tax=Microvirga sp. 2TAF3 TaxID=3233014 RepID=UPI003F9502E9